MLREDQASSSRPLEEQDKRPLRRALSEEMRLNRKGSKLDMQHYVDESTRKIIELECKQLNNEWEQKYDKVQKELKQANSLTSKLQKQIAVFEAHMNPDPDDSGR